MSETYILHTKDGLQQITHAEAIDNAKQQEAQGLEPMFCFWDFKRNKAITPPGWLVWSTWDDGAGVVYKHPETGRYGLVRGWQGEFVTV